MPVADETRRETIDMAESDSLLHRDADPPKCNWTEAGGVANFSLGGDELSPWRALVGQVKPDLFANPSTASQPNLPEARALRRSQGRSACTYVQKRLRYRRHPPAQRGA